MVNRLFQKKKKEQMFWDWFTKNENAYFHFENDQDILFTKLQAELEKIHPNLVFEFSSVLEDGTREFVISADGIKSIFPIVIDLVKQAPILNNWKIIAFRQPKTNSTRIHYQNIIVDFNDVFFRYAKNNGKICLELNIRNFHESPEWNAAIFILLDKIIGEYHTEMSLGYIDKKVLNESEINTLYPIEALPKIIHSHF